MSSPRIRLRDEMREMVASLEGFDDSRVHLYKMDSVEKDSTPCASIYLSSMTSNIDTMGMDSNNAERSLRVYVDLHLDKNITDADNDADAIMDGWLVDLERMVWERDNTTRFADGDIQNFELTEAEFRPTERSKERRGDLITEWTATFDECITSP